MRGKDERIEKFGDLASIAVRRVIDESEADKIIDEIFKIAKNANVGIAVMVGVICEKDDPPGTGLQLQFCQVSTGEAGELLMDMEKGIIRELEHLNKMGDQ